MTPTSTVFSCYSELDTLHHDEDRKTPQPKGGTDVPDDMGTQVAVREEHERDGDDNSQ